MNKTNYLKLQRSFTQIGGGLVNVWCYNTMKVINMTIEDTVITAKQKIKNEFNIEYNYLHEYIWTYERTPITDSTIRTLDGKTTHFEIRIIDLTHYRTNTFMRCLGKIDSKESKHAVDLKLYDKYMQTYDNYKLANITDEEKKERLFPCLKDIQIYSRPGRIPKQVIDAVFNPALFVLRSDVLETNMKDYQKDIIRHIGICITALFNPESLPSVDVMRDILVHMEPLFITVVYTLIAKELTESETLIDVLSGTQLTRSTTKQRRMREIQGILRPCMIQPIVNVDGSYEYDSFYNMCDRLKLILKKIFT